MRSLLLVAFVPWLVFSLGCVAFTDELGQVALDYEIDRVRVPAIRLDPPIAVQGQPVTVEALILSPWPIEDLSVEACGLDASLPVEIRGFECFDNPDLVEAIASELPAIWQVPDVARDCTFDTADGVDTGLACSSQVPLLVTARSEHDVGMGSLSVRLVRDGPDDVRALHDSDREFFFLGHPASGEDIALVYRIDWDGDLEYRWYVDDGVLQHTGRTATTWLQGERHTTRNELAIPEDYTGPLRVVVVTVDNSSAALSGNVTWDVLIVDVQ